MGKATAFFLWAYSGYGNLGGLSFRKATGDGFATYSIPLPIASGKILYACGFAGGE
jgi:hypothetical protein